VETIFDYNINEKEMAYIYISYKEKKSYLENTSIKKILHDLYLLFCIRDDIRNCSRIMKQIKDLRVNPNKAA
jgi:hypothetical protein